MIRFIRHAECTNNVDGNTESNSPLTDNGKEQCKHLDGEYELAICSTMMRACQTLDFSNIKYGTLMYTPLCREIMDGGGHNYYNGETKIKETDQEFSQRIKEFKELLQEQLKKYSKIVVISHGVFLATLTGGRYHNAWSKDRDPL
jgi:broad specificity phosphatase PhoE